MLNSLTTPVYATKAELRLTQTSAKPEILSATVAITTSLPSISGPTTVSELFTNPAYYPSGATLPGETDQFAGAEIGANANGSGLGLSTTPIFESNLFPANSGNYSMDWGDVERDGDLDLAIGSTNGTTVYRNNGSGGLTSLWGNFESAFDVQWFNDGDEFNQELVAVGRSNNGTPSGEGINYIYTVPQLFGSSVIFTSTVQLFRVAPGDYNDDSLIDLMVSTNMLNPPDNCPVYLYINDGSGTDRFDASTPSCVRNEATASLTPADFDNDGDLDLALSSIQTQEFIVLENQNFPTSNAIPVDSGLVFPASDAAWGDINQDGFLDLALALPFQQEVRIYQNNSGATFTLTKTLVSNLFLTPLSLDWADFNHDGLLDLAVAELPPKIYDGASNFTTVLDALPSTAVPLTSRIRDIRGIDLDNDIDLDLAFTDEFGPVKGFSTIVPPLHTKLTPLGPGSAQSVAWGDVNNDDYLDLLFGSDLYTYMLNTTQFISAPTSGLPTASVSAFGEVLTQTGETAPNLDVVLGAADGYKLYTGNGDGTFTSQPSWDISSNADPKSLALGHLNLDRRLDLLIGNDNANATVAYRNFNGNLLEWTSPPPQVPTHDLAWVDFNRDGYLDFAAANGSSGVQIYRNNRDRSFTLANTITPGNARSLAWADLNGDNLPDLAVGVYGATNQIYRNDGGTGQFIAQWPLNDTNNTTGIAWADWDNDGDLDLAVGNDGQQDQVYLNTGTVSAPGFQPFWSSQEISPTTGIAWGDKDGDGDLDLAVSQGSGGQNGFYENHTILPSHIPQFTQNMPLPRNATYVSIERPGSVPAAGLYSSGELAGYLSTPPEVININFKLFDPDGPNGNIRGGSLATPGDPIRSIRYEYALDGDPTWTVAIPGGALPTISTRRDGQPLVFPWNVSTINPKVTDNARFRITIIYEKPAGPVQRVKTSAVSPPFRIRADSNCVWPANPSITIPEPPNVPPYQTGEIIQFQGNIEPNTGSGILQFTWNFGDGTGPTTAQIANHFYLTPGTYTPVLTVTATSPECSDALPVVTKLNPPLVINAPQTIIAPKTETTDEIYLPLILKSGAEDRPEPGFPFSETAPQVDGLHGAPSVSAPGTQLTWTPVLSSETILGYRVYRASTTGSGAFQLLVVLPPDVTHYLDQTVTCGHMYYVTAYNAEGESDASTASYFSSPCP